MDIAYQLLYLLWMPVPALLVGPSTEEGAEEEYAQSGLNLIRQVL